MENITSVANNSDYQKCIHHWFIDEKNFGICKKCGDRKQFSNSWTAAGNHRAWAGRPDKAVNKEPENNIVR